ncbi:hypothetical protein M2404_003768 [Rheinheimera pacifica]|uniref:hypothetical protein n=1 Tax=Rheinheimera pacifica TaxID=173990 RepID=UPI0021670576|nr:hypothetical protein [Rheinheimera pacifica]MCS4309396.1 hypothetical protein [Rheinheimera pacifica]
MISQSSFRVTLQIHHPSLSADEIVDNFSYPIRYKHSVGMSRKTKTGQDLGGIYLETAISFKLHDEPIATFEYISKFLLDFLENFDKDFLGKIISTGGKCSFLFGIYSNNNVFLELSPVVINYLSSLGFGIKLDFYGGE